ncbi:MAG TPA: hypothetical protein DFI00_01870 [Rhodospirillaceae bacterium]|nr:hypothetical protein [Alphaproteobacteria bacterium]OUT41389.1 MAG: hypothetical protein CBB62_03315 [Micavibrio sp. TMED2]HCI46020.1 hypothetical protein [Rhodospirillaceae bacterium]MAS47069.1 hypothetical protein [Alphaproteobacteria bacterium]MAX95163.1 hypothetical protein [Alphaproteobacteria bacterium]|tara:strand:- start:762 stop:1388 length:627 start_codon:yes stop_codon:yes gene_type:complete
MADKYPDGEPNTYDSSKSSRTRDDFELLQDIAFTATEKQLPALMQAIGKPQYASKKIRVEPIDQQSLDAASAWDQPDRKQWVDDYDWHRIWENYAEKPNRFGLAIWVDQPDGKSVLAGMAAGSVYDDREPGRIDLDYIESPKKSDNPIPGRPVSSRLLPVSMRFRAAISRNCASLTPTPVPRPCSRPWALRRPRAKPTSWVTSSCACG